MITYNGTQDNRTQAAHRNAIKRSGDNEPSSQLSRFLDIDRAKGFAISLVVWGHVPSASIGYSPTWYNISIAVIYSFHMPIFMYLSGFVFFLVDGPGRFWRSPAKQIKTRFNRLIIPFISFGLLVVLGKYIASSLGGVADPVTSVSSGLSKVIINTPDNPSIFIWYLLVLFIYTIITPILWRLGGGKIYLIFLVGVIGWVVSLPEIFYLKRLAIYFIFFGMGGIFALHRGAILQIVSRFYIISVILFLIICYAMYDSNYALLICGLASIPAIHGLFLQDFWRSDRVWLTLGRYSMAIYLLNTIVIGVAKLFSLPYISNSHVTFLGIVTMLFVLGLIGPMIIRKGLSAMPALRPVARYLD